ncbi:Gly-Xaa carboxypeptidase [Trifolium repens]|nr:Gly-Xaa carboxypeptidase [Trifolium repens]
MARSSDDEPVLLMAYESDDDEPVKLTFSDSEEVSEDDYEIGVRLYDSESESEVSEDESESEDDSEDEEVSEPESSEDESEDEGDSEGSDSEGSDSEGSDSEGSDSEESDSEGSEGGRTSDNIPEARASEGETYESPTSEEEEDLEGGDSESDGGDDSDGASDSDPESSGDPDSEDVGSGGQASEFDHDFEGGPSEGRASIGSPASSNGHVSKGRVSGSIQDSEGGASGVGCPVSDTVPELEEDCDSGIDYGASSGVQGSEGASSEVRSSEFVTTEEILEKQVWLQAMTEELEILRYDFLGPSDVKTNAELIDSDWSEDKNLRRGQVQNEVLEAAHCSAQKQLADALMKDVKAEHFIHLRDGIGVAEIEFAEYELRNGSGKAEEEEAKAEAEAEAEEKAEAERKAEAEAEAEGEAESQKQSEASDEDPKVQKNSEVQDIDDTSMGFRLLRLHGHQVSADVFKNFEKSGQFFCYPGQSSQSVAVMFNLYRASQVLFKGEKILEDAKNFSAKFLTKKRAANELVDKWIITKDLPGEVSSNFSPTGLKVHHNHSERWYSESELEGFGLSKKNLLFACYVAAASIFEPERLIKQVVKQKQERG